MWCTILRYLGVTVNCDSMALTSVSDKSYRRASMKRLIQTRRVNINHHGNRGGRASARHIYFAVIKLIKCIHKSRMVNTKNTVGDLANIMKS